MMYEKQKGFRIKNRFWLFVSLDKSTCGDYWWVYSHDSLGKGTWVKWSDIERPTKFGFSNRCGRIVKSERAFRRRLKQWKSQLPKGTRLTLVSRCVGYNIEGVIK